jgi:hypothetical protein
MSLYLRATGTVVALAAIAFLTYRHYHHSGLVIDQQPVTVLVAKVQIPKGTVGNWIAKRPLYTVERLRQSQVMKGAFDDTSSLRGKVATQDIPRGSQLTTAEFKHCTCLSTGLLSG